MLTPPGGALRADDNAFLSLSRLFVQNYADEFDRSAEAEAESSRQLEASDVEATPAVDRLPELVPSGRTV